MPLFNSWKVVKISLRTPGKLLEFVAQKRVATMKGEQNVMEELAKRKDSFIANADKGGAVVIMEEEKYINEANRQLSDKHNYKTLQEDPTLQCSKLVNDTINSFFKKTCFLKN